MAEEETVVISPPAADLKAKAPRRLVRDQSELVARAEAVLDSMQDQMTEWMNDEIDAITDALAQWQEGQPDAKRQQTLYRRAHDAKGQARTFGYPVIERLAASLNRLLKLPPDIAITQRELAAQHVAAIKAAYREQIRDETDPVAATLAEALEQRVNQITGSPEAGPIA